MTVMDTATAIITMITMENIGTAVITIATTTTGAANERCLIVNASPSSMRHGA